MLGIIGGAAVGATLGILFAPAKGTVTRRRIAKTTRDIKNNVTDKLEEIVESAETLIEEIKENATDCFGKVEEEVEEVIKGKKSK